jgi:hypothetical protein
VTRAKQIRRYNAAQRSLAAAKKPVDAAFWTGFLAALRWAMGGRGKKRLG